MGYDDQVNLYAYVGNDPVNHTDPNSTSGGSAGETRFLYDDWGMSGATNLNTL